MNLWKRINKLSLAISRCTATAGFKNCTLSSDQCTKECFILSSQTMQNWTYNKLMKANKQAAKITQHALQNLK